MCDNIVFLNFHLTLVGKLIKLGIPASKEIIVSTVSHISIFLRAKKALKYDTWLGFSLGGSKVW